GPASRAQEHPHRPDRRYGRARDPRRLLHRRLRLL
ncbi:MAG: hypothetical protein AVDCRST_MAG17-1216, partial [uncultured Solirubrobacterales bacterium]